MLTAVYQAIARRWSLGTLILALLAPAAAVQAISVSISDNIMVLSDRQRSGQIDLLSMTPSPVEFTVSAADLPAAILDGRDYVRWSPTRVSIPGNRSSPLRLVFRPPADLAPGEYVVRLQVQSREVNYQPGVSLSDGTAREGNLGVSVALQPVLPVTVYLRHQIASPLLNIAAFDASSADPGSHGHFMARKAPSAISFLGTVALVGERSGRTLSSGRLRMGQTVDELRIRVPRGSNEAPLDESVCLHLWPQYPGEGAPEQIVCSD